MSDRVEGHLFNRLAHDRIQQDTDRALNKLALPLCSRKVRMGGWTFRCVRERGHPGRCQA